METIVISPALANTTGLTAGTIGVVGEEIDGMVLVTFGDGSFTCIESELVVRS